MRIAGEVDAADKRVCRWIHSSFGLWEWEVVVWCRLEGKQVESF